VLSLFTQPRSCRCCLSIPDYVYSCRIEITLSTGYYVNWYKELVIFSGNTEKARLLTKNDDHGPKTIMFKRDDFPSGAIKLEFFKAGFLGVKTRAYTRYLDSHWCCGKTIHFLWQRERFSSNQRDG